MVNVLIVDDSALVRKVLSEIINSVSDFNLVGTAHDPIFAIEKLKKQEVDVIILDVEMPRMDGLTFLDKLMRAKPTTVIVFSSLTEKNAALTLQAFELGAFDVLTKPENLLDLSNLKDDIIQKVRNGARKEVKNKLLNQFRKGLESLDKPENQKPVKLFTTNQKTTDKVIVIGSSTGGTVAIEAILKALPVDIPGIVVVQHMPVQYSAAFANRLDSKMALKVKVAENGERIMNGFVYLAAGEIHCQIRASGAKYYIEIVEGPRVNYHRPSVEPLFKSAAKNAGPNAIGIMLTGMGEDGSKAMREMKDAGSYNIVQDQDSSVVWGMPGKAYEYGAASALVPLNKIADHLCRVLKGEIK
ncbi:protein-glutamate methylesterase/protein-glutamine glutaminase [Spirochaeta cellobiosiphila]|uniref:protein-glutamate methylesterase/protein-glutamine glutaminase n=1 Tax=Spirochaeta cellobiosiphila TaxID=504483 RepID=UPI0003FE0646|nr:chemotaxis response regulator protein-glutamate methylesterase [Spirochaeta cellobiosiphila]